MSDAYLPSSWAFLGPWQDPLLNGLQSRPRALYVAPTGTGKTVTGISWLRERKADLPHRGAEQSALVVVPASLVGQWELAIERFAPDLHVGTEVEVTSYESLCRRKSWDHQHSVILADEVGMVRGGKGRAAALRFLCDSATHVLGMTATPMHKSPETTFAVAETLGLERPSRADFESEFLTYRQTAEGRRYLVGVRNSERLANALGQDIVVVSPADAGLDLPDVIRAQDSVQLIDPEQTNAYARADAMRGALRGTGLVTACLAAHGRSGYAEAIAALIAADPRKTVVFAPQHAPLDILAELLARQGIDTARIDGTVKKTARAALVERFCDPSGPTVMLGTKALEVGVDGLQHACDRLISCGTDWDPASEDQRIGRLARHGSPFEQVEHLVLNTDTAYDRTRRGPVVAGRRRVIDVFSEGLER